MFRSEQREPLARVVHLGAGRAVHVSSVGFVQPFFESGHLAERDHLLERLS